MREYKNYSEIERDLKLLELQKEIDKERVLLSYNLTKESLAPKNILKRTTDKIMRNKVVLNTTTSVLGFIGDKLDQSTDSSISSFEGREGGI